MGKTAGVPVAVKVDAASSGKEANRRCLELLILYYGEQKLILRRLNFDELW
ncbi:MAG: hypothetical protein WAL03_10060 [Pseudolabrys sp.]